MFKNRQFTATGTSVAIHTAMLFVLWLVPQYVNSGAPSVVLETVFDEELVQEEFSRELETSTEIAETQNVLAGGAISTLGGGSGAPAIAQRSVDTSESLKVPDVRLNVGEITLPGEELLGEDLGEQEVSGEVGAVVEGYGAALGRLTQELIRLMRQQPVLVVWLFDESNSMKDDQREIRDKFHQVYEELGIQTQRDKQLRSTREILVTAIFGFGQSLHPLTKEPTADLDRVRAAIDHVGVDETGQENMCQAVVAVVDKYGPVARRTKRRLVVVVVSDESPSDHMRIEDAIVQVRKFNAPVYILGREAIFGYPQARIRWQDPVYGLWHWVWIDRGPETEYAECLQYDGLHARHDSFSSGFGPYPLVRLAKQSGGIYFMLPGEEEDLTGPGANEKRQFDALAMKEYQPLLLARRDYASSVQNSKFRTALWQIIVMLNPRESPLFPRHDPELNIRTGDYASSVQNSKFRTALWQIIVMLNPRESPMFPRHDPELNIRTSDYSIAPPEFQSQCQIEFRKALRVMGLLNTALATLEKVAPLRAKEESQRWRANFDLIYAQCLQYRVRLFQFLLAMDEHFRDKPRPKGEKTTHWHLARSGQMRQPDDEQFRRIRAQFNVKLTREEYLTEVQRQEQLARQQYELVEREHPGTPWARRAQYERSLGYGMAFHEHYHDPRYRFVGTQIKIPNF